MRRLSAALAIIFAAVGIGSGVVHATPTGCHRYLDTGYDQVRVYCSGGTGQYRAGVKCDARNGNGVWWVYAWNYVPPGNWSIVYCSTLSDLGYPGGPFDAIASTIDYK